MSTPSEFSISSASDAVFIDHDDISNYNPEQILPESDESIREIRRWLKPTSYNLESGEYKKHLSSHTPGTGEWLSSSASFKSWADGSDHGLLWIKGIPGSGKSVLAANIVDELSRSHPGAPVLFFFFRQIIDANHDPSALLRDWLDQVLIYSPPLQKKLKDYVQSSRLLSSMSMEDLWKDLRTALAGLHEKVFCIADALDEMDHGNEVFLRSLASLGGWKPEKIKVLITSRPVPSVEVPLRKVKSLSVRLQESIVDIDIAQFVQSSLNSSSVSLQDRRLIEEAVPGRANGLFLYAKLAMDSFLESNADVARVLRSLPTDLNEMYERLLREHSHRSGVPDDVQLLILQWVTHATRPLRLLELAEMLSVTHGPGANKTLESSKDLVRSACGPLLEILPDETVSVVHHSFTEFLKGMTRSVGDGDYPILMSGPTNANLGVSCLAYMSAGCLDEIKTLQKENTVSSRRKISDWDYPSWDEPKLSKEEVQMRLKFPFLAYVTTNWYTHISRSATAGEGQTKINDSLKKFFENQKRVDAWLKLCWPGDERASGGVTQLHIAAKLGLEYYVDSLLSSGEYSVDESDVCGKTPLWWAASCGHASVVRLLIGAGAKPDHDEPLRGLKPLHQAAKSNHFETVRALLEAGVNPLTEKTRENPGRRCGNAPRTYRQTPLMYACHNGHEESVDVFLSFISDIDVIHRALGWAAEKRQSKVVERILRFPDVDVNAKVRGDTPLFRAASTYDFATLSLLINAGADPRIFCEQSRDEFAGAGFSSVQRGERDPNRGYTALHRLCSSGRGFSNNKQPPEDWYALFTLFVDAGSDIHVRTPGGCTPLHLAVENPVMVRLLLDAGADANAIDNQGRTPLYDVKNMTSMSLLIEVGGADINITLPQSDRSLTPLLYMLSSYHTESILKFSEYMPDCNVTDIDGNGALHLALRGWKTDREIIQRLLAAGANPNLRNNIGESPLHGVSQYWKNETGVIDLLLEAGVDINIKDFNGATLLSRLITRNWSGNKTDRVNGIKMLIDKGASIDTRDNEGRTLLHEAVKYHPGRKLYELPGDDSPYFDLILSLGVDPSSVDYRGNSLFHELAKIRYERYHVDRHLQLWRQLVALGLNINHRNHQGRSPLHVLCTEWKSKVNSLLTVPLDFVISNTNEINLKDNDGLTPLHLAVTVSEVNTKKLLDAGADPSVSALNELTPLHLAARSRQGNIVGLLIESLKKWNLLETGINKRDNAGWTPLSYACRSGRPEIVALLLDSGADIRVGSVFKACIGFEEEQEFWKSDLQPAKKENYEATGVTEISGMSPPKVDNSSRGYDHLNLDPLRDTARLEEILIMLVDGGADLAEFKEAFFTATSSRSDYIRSCFLEVRDKMAEENNQDNMRDEIMCDSLTRLMHKNDKESTIRVVSEWMTLRQGDMNLDIIREMLLRRQYYAVEMLANLGGDFLKPTKLKLKYYLDAFVEYGYATLLGKIGVLEAGRKFKDGIWHAAGDSTQPGLGACPGVAPDDSTGVKSSGSRFLVKALCPDVINIEVLRILVEKLAVDINEPLYTKTSDSDGNNTVPSDSALHQLAHGWSWWHVALAMPYLINQGANLELRLQNGCTPLHVALKVGDSEGPFRREAALRLIAAGADVNALNGEGKSCIGLAGNDVDITRELIAHGAVIRADAIFTAIDSKRVDVLEALLDAGADPNMRRNKKVEDDTVRGNRKRPLYKGIEEHEWYPIHYAATKHYKSCGTQEEMRENRRVSVKNIELLLKYGGSPLAKFLCPQEKSTQGSSSEFYNGADWNVDIPERLILGHTDSINSRIPSGQEECTVLHDILIEGDQVFPSLFNTKTDPNHRDSKGRTILLAACSSKNGPDVPFDQTYADEAEGAQYSTAPSILDHLLSLGADPLAVDINGSNALHHILLYQRHLNGKFMLSLAKLAKEHPRLMNQANARGKTPMHLALVRAACTTNPATVETLLAAGADPHLKDALGNCALHYLAPRLVDSVKMRQLFVILLSHGLSVNSRNKKGETPLFIFYKPINPDYSNDFSYPIKDENDEEAAIRIFEASNADFLARDAQGRGLLHVAAEGGTKRFQQLLKRGLDIGLEDDWNKTALDVAAACGNEKVLKLYKRKNNNSGGGLVDENSGNDTDDSRDE